MSDIKKKITEAVTKKLKEKKAEEERFIFEGIDPTHMKTLDEFFQDNDREDFIWEDSLEDDLYSEEEELYESVRDSQKRFYVGDVIMTTKFKSQGSYKDSPHRILVITSKDSENGIIQYAGFLLSSKVYKSNKMGRYPNNIYIKDYSTILARGAHSDKEAFIRVDDIVTFTSEDLSSSGSWKGRVTNEFMEFVQNCYNNYKKGISNADIYWEK